MKYFILFPLLFFNILYLNAQCTSVEIDRSTWTIHDFDTEENIGEGSSNGFAADAIDGNIETYWHTKWKDVTSVYPHHISIDMGTVKAINGISLVSRNNSSKNKPKAYELFLSNDGTNWGTVQSAGEFTYPDLNANGQTTSISFGAINARYFKLVFTSNYTNDPHIVISEIYATEISGGTECVATGQNNQIITFASIPKHYTEDAPFQLYAGVNTNLPITFQVAEGPATVSGSTLSLTGAAGTVKVKALQAGNTDYYAAEYERSFEVIDLSAATLNVRTRIPENSDILMPILKPYKLWASADIEQSDTLKIDSITFQVGNEMLTSLAAANSFYAWWLPSEYGSHTVTMKAYGSNGNTSTITRTVNVVNTSGNQSVQTLDDAVIDWASMGTQWYYGTYTLPQSVGAFDKIKARFYVSCPNVAGGCDDWDRLAWVQIKNPDGQWVELFRYITPYGVACNHQIDVTDYESLLQGEVEFRVYIETWGSGGWKMDMFLDYEEGTPTYLYSNVLEVWQGNYNFGDPANLQPVPTENISIPLNTQNASFRLVTTGHGWGQNNTANAAEFYYANHKLKVNGSNTFNQNMRVTCNPNPDNCTGQLGTWQYDRAGWCPGTIPAPYFYDITPYIENDFNFTYEFQTSYMDYCHPNNPNCVSGSTCPNCNDGYNPYYRVGAYMIFRSNDPLGSSIYTPVVEILEDNAFDIYPNANSGVFRIDVEKDLKDMVIQIYDVKGSSIKTYFFKNKAELSAYTFHLEDVPNGTYFAKIYTAKQMLSKKIVIQR